MPKINSLVSSLDQHQLLNRVKPDFLLASYGLTLCWSQWLQRALIYVEHKQTHTCVCDLTVERGLSVRKKGPSRREEE